jgi:hypothetical protein
LICFAEVGGLFLLFDLTRIASFLVNLHHARPSLCNKYKTDYGIVCKWDFLVAMFLLILGSGRFGIDYLLTEKN